MPRDGSGNYTQPFDDVITETTISSSVYNGTINDIETDLNAARPVIAGGTGATSAAAARTNLGAEVASALVTNYDTHVFEAGSFVSAPSATGAPVAQYLSGICTRLSSDAILLVARTHSFIPATTYVRERGSGAWGAWTVDGASRYVDVAGDTMTGNLTMTKDTPIIALNTSNAAGGCLISGNVTSLPRWRLDLGSGAEGGGNTGSDFILHSYSDAGGFLTSPLIITRAGAARMASSLTVTDKVVVKQLGGGNPAVEFHNSAGAVQGYVYWAPAIGMIIQTAAGRQYIFNDSDAYKAGGGAWAAPSDARIKTVRGNYEHGLAEILTLQQVLYTYNNASPYATGVGDQEFIGLVAQDVEGVMPECVSQSNGVIDGQPVTDLRSLDTGPLVHALINAVKELSARIEALEGAGVARNG